MTEKRRWGDRRDGKWLKNEDPLHAIIPYLLPSRCNAEAYLTEEIDIANLLAYLEKKNTPERDFKYTLFHIIAAALIKTVTLRPKMNRFVQGKRLYQRNELSVAFVAKRRFGDNEHEALLLLKFDGDDTIDSIHNKIRENVVKARSESTDTSTEKMTAFSKIPRWLLTIVIRLLRVLDYYGKVPRSITKIDPNYASIYISNLGSIKLNASYHHLNEWGTNSLFVVIGEKRETSTCNNDGSVTIRNVLNLGITLDERIADGYYYAKTFKLLRHILQNPELLELPVKEVINFE